MPEGIEVEKYEDLPDNFSLYSPPFPGAKPTAYEIHVSGDQSGVKCGQDVTVTVNLRNFKLMEMYRCVKFFLPLKFPLKFLCVSRKC